MTGIGAPHRCLHRWQVVDGVSPAYRVGMGSLRAVVVLAVAGVAAARQQEPQPQPKPLPVMTATVMPLPREMSRYEVGEPQAGGTRAAERLVAMLQALTQANETKAGARIQVLNREQGMLFVRGDAGQVELATKVLQELNKDEPPHARLQWSFATLPLAKATELGLKAGVVATTDEAAVGALIKEGTKHKGTVLNVPDVAVRPLTPFVVDATGKAKVTAGATEPAAPAAPAALKLRGEMLPLDGGDVAVAMQLVRGALPADLTRTPGAPLLQVLFRLQAGKAALVTAVEGDTATVVIVRCVEVAAEPLQEPTPAKK